MVCWPSRGAAYGVAGAENHVDVAEQLQHAVSVPGPEALGLDHPPGWDQAAGEEPIAGARVEVLRPGDQVGPVQVGTFGRRDQEGGGAGAGGLRHGDPPVDAQGSRYRGDGGEGHGMAVAGEVVVGDGEAQAVDTLGQQRCRVLDGPWPLGRVGRVVALERVPGRGEIAHACGRTGPGDRGSPRTCSCRCAPAGRRSA